MVDDPVRRIRLVENPDGHWTARDLDAEISVQGETRAKTLEALDKVIRALQGEAGHKPTDEELIELGVDPDVARSQGDLPDTLR